jgi:ribosomal protein S12 methylthiotransferase
LNKKPGIHITTLGCAKNIYDSEILMGQLQANGIPLLDDPRQADIIIINTCGFITPAKQESINVILEAIQNKNRNNHQRVFVVGCLSSRYRNELTKEIPEVDEYFGTEDYTKIMNYLNLEIKSPNHLYKKRIISTKAHYAYLKISEGCNHKCAFCAIPLIRGVHRSRPMLDIISEAKQIAAKGVKELILIAQDITYYGNDLYGKQKLGELLLELEKIKGLEWIRIHYAYPTTFQDSLIDIIKESDKIVHYIDLPIQHISDRMLRIMKRGGTSKQIIQILEKLRYKIPDIALRTTLIVGHPGETEADYRKLKEFIQEFQFDRLGIFTYSPEENTVAYQLAYPKKEIAEERYAEIMEIQQQISLQKNQRHIAKKIKIIIDEIDQCNRIAIGRTYADSPEIDNEVILEDIPENIQEGNFYYINIYHASEYELFGKLEEKK